MKDDGKVLQVVCIDNHDGENFLTVGKVYDVVEESDWGYEVCNDDGWNSRYSKEDFKIYSSITSVEQPKIDSHYAFTYTLTKADRESGTIKIDPYFVAKLWRTGERDPSGVIWHIFKTCARFGEKNSKQREITAIYKSIKRLAELEGVNLE